ncbi:MAG: DinB family protein [Saprospiraceae bacterium]|nr:DinB family protein [Saprospiraceae bacterium]
MSIPAFIISALTRNRDVFSHLLAQPHPDQIQWSQDPTKWSLLQIVCHLRDEESEDFRSRLRMVLDSPGVPFPGINPTGWVVDRNYAGQDYTTVLRQFLQERDDSIAWLNGLRDPQWDNATVHPRLGPMSGHFVLANWLAHDHLHIRQIIRLQYDFLAHLSGTSIQYAGFW